MPSVWQTLSSFDVSEEVKKKGKFDYLSWTWAWAYVKQHYPHATFEKHIFRDNQDNPLPFMRDTKGHTYVAVTVTIDEIAHTEIHYVMDHKNQSVVHPDGGQVNKASQRCLVKAIAFHGLGINVYAGEDLPLSENEDDAGEQDELKAKIIQDFANAKTVDDIDTLWKVNAQAIGTFNKQRKSAVTNAFKKEKTRIKAAEAA